MNFEQCVRSFEFVLTERERNAVEVNRDGDLRVAA